MRIRTVPIAIAVVDPNPWDYADLLRNFPQRADCISFATSIRAALTLQTADAWIVRTSLPEMSGFEFCEVLRTRFPRSHILIIDDTYQLENELRARSCCGAMYACKPFQPASLVDWCQSIRATKEANIMLQTN